jgi:hypothetical protein
MERHKTLNVKSLAKKAIAERMQHIERHIHHHNTRNNIESP